MNFTFTDIAIAWAKYLLVLLVPGIAFFLAMIYPLGMDLKLATTIVGCAYLIVIGVIYDLAPK